MSDPGVGCCAFSSLLLEERGSRNREDLGLADRMARGLPRVEATLEEMRNFEKAAVLEQGLYERYSISALP